MRKISQLLFDFQAGIRGSLAERALDKPLYVEPEPESDANAEAAAPGKPQASEPDADGTQPMAPVQREPDGNIRDEDLTQLCRELLQQIDLAGAARLVSVQWNSRLRSTAGYASFPAWKIELNPKLQEFEGQVDRTMRHELAHLVAYHRAGRRKIEPHGPEWQQACAELGIPGESARHRLPLPRRQVKKNFAYACAHCGFVVQRVRKFHRHTACRACCSKYSGGQYDSRFRFVLLKDLRQDGE